MKRIFVTYLVILAVMLSSQMVHGESTKQNIEVLFNNIVLTINGQKIDKETLLYNDTTYVPIRAVAEALGKNVSFDETTQTADISDNTSANKNNGTLIWPLSSNKDIIKGYYTYTHPITNQKLTHTGLDIKAPVGSSILAIKDGVVLVAEETSGYGKYIIIEHKDETYSLYAHTSEIFVYQSQEIKQGDVIGKTGTDRITGDHLHFEIRNKDADPVNPIDYYIK